MTISGPYEQFIASEVERKQALLLVDTRRLEEEVGLVPEEGRENFVMLHIVHQSVTFMRTVMQSLIKGEEGHSLGGPPHLLPKVKTNLAAHIADIATLKPEKTMDSMRYLDSLLEYVDATRETLRVFLSQS